jgi:hypothetical protein
MGAGFRGTFVISWSQTEIDGLSGVDPGALAAGSTWRWSGTAVRLDGPADVLPLGEARGQAELRRRAAQGVRRLLGAALGTLGPAREPPDDAAEGPGFVISDGRTRHEALIVDIGTGAAPLVVFAGDLPAPERDHWVLSVTGGPACSHAPEAAAGGVICFTPGTRIRVADGARPVEAIQPGDLVQTRDNGLQEVLWVGSRRITGARLHAMPHLRPVRFRAGALGMDEPEDDLIVSPRHRVLLRGRTAEALFGECEVLVAAEDLVNDRSIVRDHALRETRYIHLLLPRHEVIWANGVATESFHPALCDPETIDPQDRAALLALLPGSGTDPWAFGGSARRLLTAPEAALLRAAGRPRG